MRLHGFSIFFQPSWVGLCFVSCCIFAEILVIFNTEFTINLKFYCRFTVFTVNVQQHLLAIFATTFYSLADLEELQIWHLTIKSAFVHFQNTEHHC